MKNYNYLRTVPASDSTWKTYLRECDDADGLRNLLMEIDPKLNNKTKVRLIEARIRRLEANKKKEANQ